MKVLASPLRIAAATAALILIIEVATIPVADDSGISDVRFLVEIVLVLTLIAALSAAAWRRVRRRWALDATR